MKVVDFLSPDAVVPALAGATKGEVLAEMASFLCGRQSALLGQNAIDPQALCRVLEERELLASTAIGDYFFCHAGVRPGTPLSRQREEDLLWIRDDFLLHEEPFEKIIVHGHTPVLEPDVRRNRINIDTGAYATGRLTCLKLEHDKILFI